MPYDTVKIWDPLVRVFHWSLALAFAVCFVTEDDLLALHVQSGYLIGGLLLFRLAWGFVGPRHARFVDFVQGPRAVAGYLRDIVTFQPRRYLGHNPAGGAMVVLLLASLTLATVTGLMTYGAEELAGPLAGLMSAFGRTGGEIAEELHEFFANMALLLVVVHLAGVLLASLQHRENLVRSMINGRKRAAE